MSVYTNPAARSVEQANAYTAAIIELLGSQDPLEVLRSTAGALTRSIAGLSNAALARPEADGKWSMTQVLQHLADSDLVWGYRLRMVLAHDRPTITGYDQDLWASRLHYADADPKQAIEEFTTLRHANLRLLSQATADDLQRVGVHAERGEESVERMIKLYAGHDLLHLRQLARIRKTLNFEL
jgi:hypothetical protein